ncbi:hypothetical protein LXL04_037922 [Taraxacum kok-saghyz]
MVGSEYGCNINEEYDLEPPPIAPYKSNEEEVRSENGYNSEYGSDSQDSDFIVDEENMLDDPEVDMNDFILNIDDNVEWIGGRGIVEGDKELSNEELEVINNELLVSDSSEEEDCKSRRRNKIRAVERARANDTAMVKDPFYIFQRFSSPEEVKERIYLHAIETRRELEIMKNDKQRIRVTCKGTIPNLGILETGGVGEGGSKKNKSKVKKSTVNKCPWVLLVSKYKKDDNWTVKTYVKDHVCLQSRKINACNYKFLSKSIIDQLETNPEIPIRALKEQLERKYGVNISDMKTFRAKSKALDTIRGDFKGAIRYTTRLSARASNKKPIHDTGKMDLLGINGAFLKGPYPGQVLTVVIKWRGEEFKDCLWKAAIVSTVPQFSVAMEELRQAHCDALLNNMCETLNSKLVNGRDKPFITCLEFIREYIMKKLVLVQKTVDSSPGPLTSTANKTLEKIKIEAPEYRAVFCGNDKYQVSGHGLEQFVVDMKQQTCSCYRWELTGMPCKHTIAAIWDMRRNNEAVGIPETWVHPTYWLKTWKEMYAFKVAPINGRLMWEKSVCPTKLLPPKHHVPIGRPKKRGENLHLKMILGKLLVQSVEIQVIMGEAATDNPMVEGEMQPRGIGVCDVSYL